MLVQGIEKPIIDLFGRQIRHSSIMDDAERNNPNAELPKATFKTIVIECLTQPMESDRGKDFKHYMELFNTAEKVKEAQDSVELCLEELAVIKKRVTESPHMIVVKAHVYRCLEGK